MIQVRRYAEFHADFPDDWVWNADETYVVQTGGKAVAKAIADILAGFGCVIGELEDNVEHCWECSFSYEGLPLLFRVVDLQPCIFILEEPHRARRDYALHLHVLMKLDNELRRDGRFHDLAWYAHDGVHTGKEAFDVPVVGDVPAVEDIKPWERQDREEFRKLSFLDKLLAPLKVRPEDR